MDNLDEDRMVELLSRKVLTEAEEDELFAMMKPKLREPVLSQKETDELLDYMKQGSRQPRKVLTEAEEDELWELSKPKKTQPLSEAEVNELLSAVQPDFQSLAKMRENQRLRHLNIDTKTKNQEHDFTPDEINQMTEYFRRANKEIYQQKKINVSGAEADRLLRKVQFTENNPEQTQTDRVENTNADSGREM